MNARIDFQAMGQEAVARINEARALRAFKLFEIRCELGHIGRNGGLSPEELFELVCCLQSNAASHLTEAKASLTDLACDLEGIVHYGSEQ
jgi:hypothetical protein